MIVGEKEFEQIVIIGNDDEVLAFISDQEVIERSGCRVVFELTLIIENGMQRKSPLMRAGERNLIGRVFKHIGAAAEVINTDMVKLGASTQDVDRRGLLTSFNPAQSRCAYTQ